MSVDLELAKCINQYTKDVVSGYIRDIQSLLPYEQNAFYIIPQLIQSIILLFYYGEYFSASGDKIKIDDKNPNSIFYKDDTSFVAQRVYGNIDIVGGLE